MLFEILKILITLFVFLSILKCRIFTFKLTNRYCFTGVILEKIPNFWAIISETFAVRFWYVKSIACFGS